MVDLDEAWTFLQVAQGKALSNKLIRAGRSMNAAVYFVTQNSGDVDDEKMKNNIGLKFAFRSTDIKEIKNTLEFFGVDKEDEGNQKRLRDLEKGGHEDSVTWNTLQGTFWQKQWQAIKISLKDAFGLFKGVIVYLIIGAGIGAFIYEFIPTDLLANFAGTNSLWAVPLAAIIGIPMYIRTETMIPIASILIAKGVAPGIMIALILGGAGASIPEVSLLNSIFKKKMVIAFVLCIFTVATITGYAFNFII